MGYPGGKNGAGIYQTIINQIPPHTTYIEPFLGGGAIMRLKKPADKSIGIDMDKAVVEGFPAHQVPGSSIVYGDGIYYLESLMFDRQYLNNPSTFIYLDPPYVLSTRTRLLYNYELSDGDHHRLLAIIKLLRCNIAISGYYSQMYALSLQHWREINYQAKTRGNTMKTEYLWMNYDPPQELHDYRYLGDNYRQRENLARKKSRWIERLNRMPLLEKYALLSAIQTTQEKETTT